MEKRTPALWRFSSDTTRQASSASLRVLNGPCTWAEPSTSLWKFIEPNSPPITQKLLPLVMIASCLFRPLLSRLNLDFRTMRLELRGFGRIVKRRGRRGAAGDGGRHQIEVAGADFALMARRRIAVLLGCELGLLQAGIGRHAFGLVAARQFEHAVVERVETRQRDKLELVAHRADFALDAVRESRAGLESEETFRGPFAGNELAIALVHVGGDQFCTLRVRARQHKSRRAADVGGQARRDQVALMR